ncbi:MAG: hypothetical protein ACYCTB_11020 [bacterium]
MSDQELVLDLDVKGDEIHFHCKGYDKEFIALIGEIISGRHRCDRDNDKQEAELNYIGEVGGGGPYPSNKDKEEIIHKSTVVNKTDIGIVKPDSTEKPISNNTKENIDLNNNVVVSKMETAELEEVKRLKRLAKMKEWRKTHKEERKEYDKKRLLNKKANANKVNKKESIVIDKVDKADKKRGRGIIIKDKESIIKDIQNGFSLSQIKDKYNIGGTTYYRYKSKCGMTKKKNWETKKSESTVIDIDKLQSSIIQNSLNGINLSEDPKMAEWQKSMVARGL